VSAVYFSTLVGDTPLRKLQATLRDAASRPAGDEKDFSPESMGSLFGASGRSGSGAASARDWTTVDALLLRGYVLLFLDGFGEAVGWNANALQSRQVTEPENEPVVQGPREGTVEDLDQNIGMIRMRVKSPALKFEAIDAGGYTDTRICYGYLDGAADPALLEEFRRRIARIRPGEILDTSYIEEVIEDSVFSPFPQVRYTERTDSTAAALLGGKIVVLTQGSGSVLICPGLFFDLLQSSEDYYQRVMVSNFIRWLRLVALLIAISLPSLYIAVSTFHPELIPTVLLLAIIDSREGIPFGAFIEALIMVFFLELLKEAGIRLPRTVGSAVSIVGALVIGEAAMNAGIASPIMVVVVSLTGIASFALPQYNLSIAMRLIQFPLMALAAMLGGFGILLGYLFIWIHLSTLTSLNVPYLTPVAPWNARQLRDTIVRAPLLALIRRPRPPRTK